MKLQNDNLKQKYQLLKDTEAIKTKRLSQIIENISKSITVLDRFSVILWLRLSITFLVYSRLSLYCIDVVTMRLFL